MPTPHIRSGRTGLDQRPSPIPLEFERPPLPRRDFAQGGKHGVGDGWHLFRMPEPGRMLRLRRFEGSVEEPHVHRSKSAPPVSERTPSRPSQGAGGLGQPAAAAVPVLDVSHLLGGYLRHLAGPPTRYPFPRPVTRPGRLRPSESFRPGLSAVQAALFTMTATHSTRSGAKMRNPFWRRLAITSFDHGAVDCAAIV